MYELLLTKIDCRCFKKCVGPKFGSSTFEKREETCVQNCVDRFFDAHIFIVNRYGSELSSFYFHYADM